MNATLPGSSLKDFSRILTCFSRVGDEVSLEVKPGKLMMSTLNASKSAFILTTFNATRFEKFEFLPPRRSGKVYASTSEENTLRCKLQLRSLLSIFRPRNIDDDASQCQLLIRLVCKHGVRKTYKLQYEQTQTMHAVTDRSTCHNRFLIGARALKDVMDHFAPRAEELTLAVNDGSLLLTSFTEGVSSDKEVLKQPVHTSISIDNKEFEVMEVDEEIQITFGLREFKALGTLCDLLNTDVSVLYSDPGKPLLVEFEKEGIIGEFVVATTGDGERRETKPPISRGHMGHDRYQPRTIAAVETGSQMIGERTSDWHPLTGAPGPREIDSKTSPVRRDRSSEDRSPVGQFDRSALFAPDPDTNDQEVMNRRDLLESRNQRDVDRSRYDRTSGGLDVPEPDFGIDQRRYDDDEDEMELYADELNFEADMPLGPTQTQSVHRPKGLFD